MQMLTYQTLNVPHIIRNIDTKTRQRGQNYFYQQRARIEHVDRDHAVVRVRGSRPAPYMVETTLEDGFIRMDCDCPMADGAPDVVCKHKVAAALALDSYLRFHPPISWETTLQEALNKKTKRPTSASGRSLLVFSLMQRYANNWSIVPYSLPADLFSADLFSQHSVEDREAVARIIKTVTHGKLAAKATAIRSIGKPDRFLNLPAEDRPIVELVLLQQAYYYADSARVFASVLPRLVRHHVFFGTEADPLQRPLHIYTDPAVPEVVLDESPNGMRVRPIVILNGDVLFLDSDVRTLSADPLWLFTKDSVFPVGDMSDMLLALASGRDLVIPEEDKDVFLDRYLPTLAERITVRGAGVTWEEVIAEPVPRLYMIEGDGTLEVRLKFGYGDFELPFDPKASAFAVQRKPNTAELAKIVRQPQVEEHFFRELGGYGLKRGGGEPSALQLRATTSPIDFLIRQVGRLATAGYEVYGEEALKSARVNRNRPTISFNVSSGIDWFDVQAAVHFGDVEVSLKEIRGALRKRERYIKLADGSIGEIPEDWLERYRHLFAFAEETETGLRLAEHQVTLLDQVLEEADRFQSDEEYKRRRERLRGFENIGSQPLPIGLTGELRPYQKSGYDWLHFLHDYGFGGCLADDMGVGKTIQTLAFLLSLYETGKAKTASLIVMPRSLLFNWEREAARFTPSLRVLIHADLNRTADAKDFDSYDLILTTYGVMLRDIEMLREYPFHYAILDESQAIKNPMAQTGRAARQLRPSHRLVLTGTPVENSAIDLWSQFAFINPGMLGNIEYFKDEFAGAIERRNDGESVDLLRKMVFPFILRRTKDQVAPELPPRTERIELAEMEPAQRKLYDKTRDYYRAQLLGLVDEGGMNDARMKILEGLLRLRQICNHPKLVDPESKAASGKMETLFEILQTLRAEGHKALVFSQFVQMLTLIREPLDRDNVPYLYLDGKTKDRQQRVDAFQNDPEIPFFLISLKAGGVGLNLTAADYVIHIDPWWNPAVERQASDRTHRIGQDKPVFVYKLITRDSVEDKILELQERKRALVDQLISTEESFFKSLKRDDIAALFT